jgi:hypothetical protein
MSRSTAWRVRVLGTSDSIDLVAQELQTSAAGDLRSHRGTDSLSELPIRYLRRFAARRDCMRTLPFDKTERFFGRLKITSVEFQHLQEERDGNFAGGALCWNVRADALFSDGTSAKYAFDFEPYEGKLTLVLRIP